MSWRTQRAKFLSEDDIKLKYPLHLLIWNNDHETLNTVLFENKLDDVEKKDPRGRTPLMLAVKLNHIKCVDVLTNHGANINTETDYWSVVQEATAAGNENMLKMLLERRNFQRQYSRICGLPQLLEKLEEAPDFYVEMKWEFASWMPLVTRMCPSDTYKVYKRGSKVRIDSTLVGFEEFRWVRGSTSIIFEGNEDSGTVMEIDHIAQKVYIEQKQFISADSLQKNVSNSVIGTRLKSPIITSYVDTDKITFERSKSGLWGWRQDKLESINGYPCKVFSASNLEIVTKTRNEHIKSKQKLNTNNTDEEEEECSSNSSSDTILDQQESSDGNLYNNISAEEYFTEDCDLGGRDIGRTVNLAKKIRTFKANLFLCEDYPLSLQEQIMPIVNLMATTSSHFSKLKDFIEMQLPSGFPVRIEIPLFHVFNASVTFENIFATQQSVDGVLYFKEDNKLLCFVDDSLFQPPPQYDVIDLRKRPHEYDDTEDDMLQFALESSFFNNNSVESDQVDMWEALKSNQRRRDDFTSYKEKDDIQKAVRESLLALRANDDIVDPSSETNNLIHVPSSIEHDIEFAIALSKEEEEEREKQRKLEEEMLQRVLEMSIQDK